MNIAEIPAAFRPSPTAVRVLTGDAGDAIRQIGDSATMHAIIGEMSVHFARRTAAAQKAATTRAKNAERKAARAHAAVVATRCDDCFQVRSASGTCWC